MRRTVTPAALAVALALGLTGCIAPDIVVQGAVGLTVDEQHRPVLLVEPCGASVVRLTLAGTREGLEPSETNRSEGSWTATNPPSELTEMVMHRPTLTWQGPPFTPRPGLGYIAEAGTTTQDGVITQVSFHTDDLPDLEPGTVYVGPDPETDEYREMTREGFSSWACSRS